ncbi:MAG: EamA family transporter [Alphaproteobacteria bacterium]|nr:EamA family transporter [Alphaproteobacteria bacterium]
MSISKEPYAKAAALILTASLMIVLMNMFAKLLTENGMNPIEALFYRNLGGFCLITAFIIFSKKLENFKTKRPKAQLIRAVIGNICLGLVIWANSLLPLATVSAILLSTPIIATALSPLFLNENISWFRWSCVTIGFIGALIITQPAISELSFPYIVAALGAISSAFVLICLRELGKNEDPITTTFYFLGFGSVMTSILLPFIWTGLPNLDLILIGLIVSGFLNQHFKTTAFKYGEISFLSPLKYFNVVWATILGWAVWHEIPPIHVYVGCAIIILSNILITWREQKLFKNGSR